MPLNNVLRETTTAFGLIQPRDVTSPLVVDSPHSWPHYPESFLPACKREDLLTSWDAWVDELFAATPNLGAPLLYARFPRFFIDPNRARDDIDPELVSGNLPFPLRPTEKTQKGFGLLRRNALPNILVYDNPIPADRLLEYIEVYYDAYHSKLSQLIEYAHNRFGRAVHLDCHSMKSKGNSMNDDQGQTRPDIVVSDNFGATADSGLTIQLAAEFTKAGFHTQINDPYKGAELIKRHSNPSENRHSIQIEINRSLYMNEQSFTKSDNFLKVKSLLEGVLRDFSRAL